ncbi:MAG: N-glycosylase/DNA lyase [Thermoplasmata archaeon]|jgi:N-glycosylase/DNA lyase|nr:N-glycosylase/DNA lyase [Thermoplasmata archaeon]
MRLAGPVDLVATLRGGQAFRWEQDAEGAFVSTVGARAVRYQPGRGLAVHAEAWPRASRAWHERYLGATAEDDAALARLARDPVLAPAIAAHPGLRILRQEPWETTVAFLVSANNHVLRIEGILRRLAAKGPEVGSPWGALHAFPDAATLARVPERQLRAMGLGYRAPFLRATARAVAAGEVDLDPLVGAPFPEIREALLALPGVGPKVAGCIALFALDARGAFPVDRWVLRAVSDSFFEGEPVKPREAEAFARARWGEDAGLAQQLLFHAQRVSAKRRGPDAAAWTPSSR